MRARLAVAAVGLAALVLNPSYACLGDREPAYAFTAADMKSAVEGTWTLAIAGRHYILHVAQAAEIAQTHASRALVGEAHACGKRTLVRSAHACLDTSEMPLVVELSGERTSDGMFSIHGTTFREGQLVIRVAGQDVFARVTPEGVATVDRGTLVRSSRR